MSFDDDYCNTADIIRVTELDSLHELKDTDKNELCIYQLYLPGNKITDILAVINDLQEQFLEKLLQTALRLKNIAF